VRKFPIKLVGHSPGEWYNIELRKVVKGNIFAYQLFDEENEDSGEWLLNVKLSEEAGKAIVVAVASKKTTSLHDQIKRKSIVLNSCTDRDLMYHPLGLASIVGQRLRYKRVEKPEEIPPDIRGRFTVKKYEEVSPTPRSRPFKGKLVAVVPRDQPEDMAILFFLEKIAPVFK
jgi:hypothetical protein